MMICSFFRTSGHIATVPVEDQRTVTKDRYVRKCLPKFFHTLRMERPKAGLRGILHHDNALVHRAHKTTFLVESGVQTLFHPAYNTDLAPCAFFFSKIRIKFAVADLSHLKLQWLHTKSYFATCLKMCGEQHIQKGLRGWNVAYNDMNTGYP